MSIIDVFSRRMKRERGQSPDVYRYDIFPRELKNQIVLIWQHALGVPDWDHFQGDNPPAQFFQSVREDIKKEHARLELDELAVRVDVEIFAYFQKLPGDTLAATELALDVVEIIFGQMFEIIGGGEELQYQVMARTRQTFTDAINELNERFRQHGVGYQFEKGRIVRVDSTFTHAEIVKPALQLLSGTDFQGPNEEFLKAHEHYRRGDYSSCLVECLKAFESTMKVICDRRGWTYDKATATAQKLIKACLDNRLLPAFSEQQLTSTRTLLESGIPTTRNKTAGHGAGATPVNVPAHLAAFGLHSTASNILLLVQAYKALP